MTDSKQHWDTMYRRRDPDQVSWFQAEARLSAELIARAAPTLEIPILDVGGGASTLVDRLLRAGYAHLTVLDLSGAALAHAQARLGPQAAAVHWQEADGLTVSLAPASYGVWHDRAAFHFLTDPADRRRYLAQLRHALRPGGQAILATFASHGPERCSGLPVVRYMIEELDAALGPGFERLEHIAEDHWTPAGTAQPFIYGRWRYHPVGAPAT